MWNKNTLTIYPVLVLVFIIHSCTSQRHVSADKPSRYLSTNKITDSVMLSKLIPAYFSSKLSVDLESEKMTESFSVNLKIRKDSLIWMDVKKAGISVARAAITKDSIKMIVRFGESEGCYSRSFNFINEQFDTELDFNMLQDLLIGNPMSFDEKEKFKSPKDSAYYYLTTLRKRKLRRALEHDHVYKKHPVIYQYKFYPKTFKPYQIWINDLNDTTLFDAIYPEFEQVDSTLVPAALEINAAKAAKKVKLNVKYSRTKLNEKTEFPFKFPDGCEKK